MESKVERNISLDVLKVLSCFSIVALHIFGRKNNLLNGIVYYISTFAIPIFFMVNGFLLMRKKEISYKYIVKKIYKILKIIFFWNILLAVALFVFKHKIQNPFIEVARNLIQNGIFSQFWFFGALIIIYLMLPILHKKLDLKKHKSLLLILLIICVIIDIINIICGLKNENIFTEKIIQTFRLWTWLFYFLLGGYIGRYQIEIKYKKIDRILIFMVILVDIYQYIVGKYIFKRFQAEYFYDNLFIVIYVLLIWMKIYNNPKCLNFQKYIEKMSKYIIGIYIFHPVVIMFVDKLYNFDNMFINIGVLCFTIIVSSIITEIISRIPKIKEMVRM